MNANSELQHNFLQKAADTAVPVAVYLVNGIKLQGQVDSFDDHVIMLKSSITQMIYKHAVSTIVPSQNLDL
jgi:host factor-I protein